MNQNSSVLKTFQSSENCEKLWVQVGKAHLPPGHPYTVLTRESQEFLDENQAPELR